LALTLALALTLTLILALAETRPFPLLTEGRDIGEPAAASAFTSVAGTLTREGLGAETAAPPSSEPLVIEGRSDLQADPADLKAAVVEL